jgi:hypothetical protein
LPVIDVISDGGHFYHFWQSLAALDNNPLSWSQEVYPQAHPHRLQRFLPRFA